MTLTNICQMDIAWKRIKRHQPCWHMGSTTWWYLRQKKIIRPALNNWNRNSFDHSTGYQTYDSQTSAVTDAFEAFFSLLPHFLFGCSIPSREHWTEPVDMSLVTPAFNVDVKICCLSSMADKLSRKHLVPIFNYPWPGTVLPTLCRNISHQVLPVHTLWIERCYIFEF